MNTMAVTGKYKTMSFILLGLILFSYRIFPQEEDGEEPRSAGNQTIPQALQRPERGEAPRYPQDLVIGELGQGEAPPEAYRFALDLISALAAGSREAPVLVGSLAILSDSLVEEINNLEPRSYRIGGGRTEADGSVSFMVRFLGTEHSITGELYIRQNEISESAIESKWFLDDLILEEKKNKSELNDSYRYDFSPYERFY